MSAGREGLKGIMRQRITSAFSCTALLILLVSMLGSAVITPAYAAGTLTVLNANDSGAGSLRQAISDAAAGDTIIFDSSLSGATIRLQETVTNSLIVDKDLTITNSLIVDKDLTIDGSALASKITISGDSDNDGEGNFRVLLIETGATVTLKSLIITKGKIASLGAGIVNYGTLTLISCTVSDNASDDHGGGIYSNGTLTLSGSAISNNKSNKAKGGGIAAFGTVNITNNSIISDNWALYGGGIWTSLDNDTTFTISHSTVSTNTAIFDGGGISGLVTVSDSTVSNNTSGAGNGGGIYGLVTLTNSTLSGNMTTFGRGAGLYSLDQSTITNSTISGNIASYDGGGIYVADTTGSVTITGSTLSGNQAGPVNYGGAIANRPGAITSLTNSTVSGNAGGYSGGIENSQDGTLYLSNVTMSGNSKIADGGMGGLVNRGTLSFVNTIIANSVGNDCREIGASNIILNVNNIVEDNYCSAPGTADIKLGPLADNGGPTKTHALLAGSPAIDAGDNTYCDDNPGPNNRDQRGYGRPVDGDAVPGAVCDIGAYEFGATLLTNQQPTLAQPANLNMLEDAGLQTLNLTGIGAGTGESQFLTLTASSSNPTLIPNPLVSYTSPNAAGSLSFTPVPNANGTATITLTVQDSGGIAVGGVDTLTRSFTVTVTAVNDAPSFTAGPNQRVAASAGPQTASGWAKGFSAGPANEASQKLLGYSISNSAPELFSSAPAIDASGTLTYTPKPGTHGTATLSVVVRDDGGTANAGVNTSAARTFTITMLGGNPTDGSFTIYLPTAFRS